MKKVAFGVAASAVSGLDFNIDQAILNNALQDKYIDDKAPKDLYNKFMQYDDQGIMQLNYSENFPDIEEAGRKLKKSNQMAHVQDRPMTTQQIAERKLAIRKIIENPQQENVTKTIQQVIDKMKKKNNKLKYKDGQAIGFVVQKQQEQNQQLQFIRKSVRDITIAFLSNVRHLLIQKTQFQARQQQQQLLQKLVGKQNVLSAIRNPQQYFAKHAIIGKQVKFKSFIQLATKYHQFVTMAKEYMILQGKIIKKQKILLQMAFKLDQNTIMIPTQKPDIYIKANKSQSGYEFQKAMYKAGSFLNQKQLNVLSPEAKKLILNKTRQFLEFKGYKGKKVQDQIILKYIQKMQQNIVKNAQAKRNDNQPIISQDT